MSSLVVMGVGMVFILCMFSAAKAQNELEEMSIQDEPETLKHIQGLLQNIQSLLDPSLNQSNDGNAACRCWKGLCTCCQRICVPALKIRQNGCVCIMYQKSTCSFLTKLTLGGRTLLLKPFSVSKPALICVRVSRRATLCVQLSSLRVGKGYLCGCTTLVAYSCGRIVKRINLGCFSLRYVDGIDQVSSVELPYNGDEQLIETQDDTLTQDDSLTQADPLTQDDTLIQEDPLSFYPTDENVVMMEDIEQSLQN